MKEEVVDKFDEEMSLWSIVTRNRERLVLTTEYLVQRSVGPLGWAQTQSSHFI